MGQISAARVPQFDSLAPWRCVVDVGKPFQSAATYDVEETTPTTGDLNFDQSGNPVTTVW
jgi:hypothetical protein